MSNSRRETCIYCFQSFKSLPNHLAQKASCREASDRASCDQEGLWDHVYREPEVPNAQVDMSFEGGYDDSSDDDPMDDAESADEDSVLYASNPELNNEDVEQITMYTDDEVAELLLLRILQKIGAPKYTHEMIRQWGKYLHNTTADTNGIKRREASISYFKKKYKMTRMKPTTVEATVQVLDKGQVLLSKQKGFKKYKRRTFNPYAQERSILDDEIEQEEEDANDNHHDTETQAGDDTGEIEPPTETQADDSVSDSAEIEPVTLEELDTVEKDAEEPHDQH
jgi:hypothetical protein